MLLNRYLSVGRSGGFLRTLRRQTMLAETCQASAQTTSGSYNSNGYPILNADQTEYANGSDAVTLRL